MGEMTDELVSRLWSLARDDSYGDRCCEALSCASDEIARLRAEAARLAAELRAQAGLRRVAEAERDTLIAASIKEVWYQMVMDGEKKHGWRWVVGERAGIKGTREAAVAAVRAAARLGGEGDH